MNLHFYFTPSTCSLASHIALEESGAPFEAELVKLHRPEAVETYKQVNPRGTVPALTVDGVLLTETVAITTFVARSFPEAKLMPEELGAMAQCISLMSWFSSSVHIQRRQYRAPMRFTPDEAAHPGLRTAGQTLTWANLQRIDGMLRGKTWLMGDQYTVADGYALLFYGWGLVDEQPMSDLKAFTAWKDRMLQRPAVRRALERERHPMLQPA